MKLWEASKPNGLLLASSWEFLTASCWSLRRNVTHYAAVVNYWLSGNVTESVVPISWKSIVTALKSKSVEEAGLAVEVSKMQEDTNIENSCNHSGIEHESNSKAKCDMCFGDKAKGCTKFICSECVEKHQKMQLIPGKLIAFSLADHKQKARLLKSGKLTIYQLPLTIIYALTYIHQNSRDGLFSCRMGELSPDSGIKPEKVLLLVGATGAGKSTLINGIVNYVFGVNWDDDFRFQIISDEGNQSYSQTKNITAYSLCSPILPYTLTIIDTPGFGDTGGIEKDRHIAAQMKIFFSDTSGVDTLHGIGFVTQASLARLTPTQRYIFDAVLSIFGKDVGENIFLLATFADVNTPPVLQATKAVNIPYQESFKFNNSALYACNDFINNMFNFMFWKMGYSNFENFFQHFFRAKPKSLTLTKEVLKERDQLDIFISRLPDQVCIGLSQLNILQQEEQVLQLHEAKLNANQHFTYTIDVDRVRKITLQPGGIFTTTCTECNFTCHSNCTIPLDKDKAHCESMGNDGYCKICPNKCHWSHHSNLPYVIEYYTVTETRTIDNLKRQYDSANSGKKRAEAMIAEYEKKLCTMQVEVCKLIEQARQTVADLEGFLGFPLKPPFATVFSLAQAPASQLNTHTSEQAQKMRGWGSIS